MNQPIQYGIAGSGDGHHPDADQIAAFLERALPAHERETMLAHLAVCPECRRTVALSLPPEVTAAPLPAARPRPWFAGWGLAWPAGAGLAVALAFAVYVRRETVLPKAPAPVEVARAPEPLGIAGAAPPAAASAQKAREEKEKASPLPRAAETVNQALLADRKLDRARDAEEPAEAAAQKPSDMLAAVGGSVAEGATGKEMSALKKSGAMNAALNLPSGLAVLSMAAQGSQVLAIDSAHAVFCSLDRGEHWTPVPVSWTGQAVKADLVAFGAAPVGGPREASYARQNAVTPSARVAAAASEAVLGENEISPAANRAAPPSLPAKDQGAGKGAGTADDQLTGIVTDPTGAAIPGATVTLRDAKDQSTHSAVTGADGGYLLGGLAAGTYDLRTEARGFAEQRTRAVEIRDARLNVANVTLNVGAMSQTVTVAATPAPLLQTEAQPLGDKVSAKAQAPGPPPVFTIITDRGEQWTSADGISWKKK